MKRTLFLIVALLVSLLPGAASASAPARPLTTDSVVKTACAYAFSYANIDELKIDLLAQAKRLAVNELFGEFITASTAVENFVVTSDQIRSSSVGFVRIEGDLEYRNGTDLAEVCVTVVAYTTEDDRAQFVQVQLTKRHCVTNPDLTTRQIRELARQEVLIQALIDYDNKLKDMDRDKLLSLMQKVKYLASGFIAETETYCVTAEGTVVPIEVVAFLMTSEEESIETQDEGLTLVGSWVGTYNCSQGTTVLVLEIVEETSDSVNAIFNFSAHPSNPRVPSGSFHMVGTYDQATSDLTLIGGNWISRPGSYVTVDLLGTISDNGTKYSGQVRGSSCSTFEIEREQ